MKTKDQIKEVARTLFNQRGLADASLRDVAQAMNRAYGNITYHFPNKEAIVMELYADMVKALQAISQDFMGGNDLLKSILLAPRKTFAVSLQYLFLYKDFLEILRHYPQVAEAARTSNAARKEGLITLFHQLQLQGLVRTEFGNAEIDYMMELSGMMRTFFFVQLEEKDYAKPQLETEYAAAVNRVLFPYLTAAGQKKYMEVLGEW
jgi:AcrR family transcriptional regulator